MRSDIAELGLEAKPEATSVVRWSFHAQRRGGLREQHPQRVQAPVFPLAFVDLHHQRVQPELSRQPRFTGESRRAGPGRQSSASPGAVGPSRPETVSLSVQDLRLQPTHGRTDLLTESERDDLLAYVMSL